MAEPPNNTISKWLRPNSFLTIVSIYLFVLSATGIWYLLFVATGSVLVDYSLANEIEAVNMLMIIAPAIGGILLLREGWIRTGFFVAGTALIFWVLAMGYIVLALASRFFTNSLEHEYHYSDANFVSIFVFNSYDCGA